MHWQIQDLWLASHHWPSVQGQARITQDHAHFQLGTADPEATWLDPRNPPDALSASDFSLLRRLPSLLSDALADSNTHALPEDVPANSWREALATAQQALHGAVPRLRFDHIELEREQTNPDYEHLELRISPVAVGTQHWPEWSFRLSTAIPDRRRFGSHPKLELPAPQPLLTSWYAEGQDDFGSKLELRFALPEAMDMAVWNRLNQADQRLITALIARLPSLLRQLEQAGTLLTRPWLDWQRLAADIQRIHAALEALTKTAEPGAG